jgi:hypothetical protein
MRERLKQVCLMYLTHYWRWNSVLLAIFCVIWLLTTTRGATRVPDVEVDPSLIPRPIPYRTMVSNSAPGEIVRPTQSLTWEINSAVPFKPLQPADFPNLVSLEIVGALTSDDDLKILQGLPKLTALSISSVRNPSALKFLSGLTELRYLRLQDCEIASGLRHLRPLVKLQTLVVSPRQDQIKLFEELPHLPSLEVLAFETPLDQDLPDGSLARLKELLQLRSVVMKSQPPDDIVYRKIRALLPAPEAPSLKLNQEAIKSIEMFLIFNGVFFAFLIRDNLTPQFSHSGARLVPNYATPHVIVAATLWTTFILYQVIVLQHLHVELFAAMASALLFSGCASTMFYLESNSAEQPFMPRWLSVLIQVPLYLIVSGFGMIMLTEWVSSDLGFDRFFEGQMPVIAYALIAFGICMPILAIRSFLRLPMRVHEESPTIPPLEMGLNRKIAHNSGANNRRGSISTTQSAKTRSRRLDRMLAQIPAISRSRLWISGQQFSGAYIAMWATIMAVGVYLLSIITSRAATLDSRSFLEDSLSPVVICQLFDMAALYLATQWSSRQAYLGMELLRPQTREAMIRQLYTAIARDFIPIVICQFIGTINLIWTCAIVNSPRDWILAVMLWFVLRVTTYYTLALFVLANRTTFFIKILVGMACVYVLLAGVALTDLAPNSTTRLLPQVFGLMGVAVFFVGVSRFWYVADLADFPE